MKTTRTSRFSIERFHRFSPWRKPAWRWLLAESLHRQGRRSASLKDPAVSAALAYRRALDRAGTDAKRQAVGANSPCLAGAQAIYLAGGHIRDEIEARLLAGESAETISTKTAIVVDVIQSYAATFYDVHDALGAVDWLLEEAIGVQMGSDQPPTEGQVWKC